MENKSGEAKVQKVKNWSPVWIFPIVTALIGAWILFYHYSHQGPEVTLIDCAGEAAKAAAEAMKEQHLLAEGNDPAVTEYRFTALPPQAARQTARRMLGEDFTPRLLPLEKLTAFSTE